MIVTHYNEAWVCRFYKQIMLSIYTAEIIIKNFERLAKLIMADIFNPGYE